MIINRAASINYQSTKTLLSKKHGLIDWNPDRKCLTISHDYVPYKDGKSLHNYSVSLEEDDLVAIMNHLAENALPDHPVETCKFLRKIQIYLAKLCLGATGHVPGKIAWQAAKVPRQRV